MAGPIDKTMQVLASTANAHALEVLIAALDVDRFGIQPMAVSQLIKRDSSRGQLEVIRRLPHLTAESRDVVDSHVGRLSGALRQALLHGDADLRMNALELIRATESFDQIPVLLDMLKESRKGVADQAAEAMRDLTDRLYEHNRAGSASRRPGRYLRNAAQIKHTVLTGFDRALSHFAELNHPQDVVEAVLVLGDADNFAVKKALAQSGSECRKLATRAFMTSRHPGVMQLPLDYLSKNYPPPQAFEAISRRNDPEFVFQLLRAFPKRLTPQQVRNLKQIDSVVWIDADRLSLEFIPPGLQPALVEFVTASGLPADLKLRVHEWVVRHGSPEGRLAASSVLGSIDESAVQSIVTSGLQSEDEEIQAWATSQLRSQGIPEALSILVERLDSPMAAVREAARDELQGFNVATMIDALEKVDPAVCLRAGQLIRKIDPDCFDKLRQELQCPISRRRVRAARAAQMLGMHREVLPQLLQLLSDADPLVRRAGISAVASVRTADVTQALRELLDDANLRVREDAAAALEESESLTQSHQ